MDESWKCYPKWEKFVTKDQALHDSIYQNSQIHRDRQSRLEVAREWGKVKLGGAGFLLVAMETFWNVIAVMFAQHFKDTKHPSL